MIHRDAAILKVMFGLFPDSIRQEVLGQDDFRREFGLNIEVEITLSPSDVRMQRSALFKSIRAVLAEPQDFAGSIPIEKSEWLVTRAQDARARVVIRGEQRIGLPDFTCLSPDTNVRLSWLDKQANDILLDETARDKWREVLANGPVADEQVDVLLADIALTPTRVFSGIEKELDTPRLTLANLIPSDRRYYARLIGSFAGQSKLEDASEQAIRPLVERLRTQDDARGLRFALLLCGNSLISDAIASMPIVRDRLMDLLEWAEREGDLISKIGAIEIGLAKCGDFSDIEPAIARMVRQVIQYDPADENGRYALLTGLWMLVDGQLSTIGLFRNSPPFWRRLAAIAQASLIERAMASRVAEPKEFLDWTRNVRGQSYYLQTLIDLRREPRWLPDLISSEQTRAEFMGRLTGAAHKAKDNVHSEELKALLYGAATDALPAQVKFPSSYLPGPLEGGLSAVLDMPDEIQEDLRTKLEAEKLTPHSFAALANSALIFKISPSVIELVANTLRRVKYQLSDRGPSDVTAALLFGLATAAAVTKSPDLAQQVQILTRITRRKVGVTFAIYEYLRIALMASASHSEIGAWSESVGDWLTELAFGDLDKGTAATLHSHIHVLCRIEPTLWTTCSKAEAACMALAV